jgi:flagellar hook-length control protein FliK
VVEQVVERVVVIRRAGRHALALRLEPPELGAVRIDAVLDGRTLHLAIRAELEPARERLVDALPRLREALAEHGIEAGHVTVELGLDGSGRHGARDAEAWAAAAWPRGAAPRAAGRPQAAAPPLPARPALAAAGMDLWV